MHPLADRVLVQQLAKRGKTATQIVEQTGFSWPFVSRWMHRKSAASKHGGRKSLIGRDERQVIKRLLKRKTGRPSLRKVSVQLRASHNIAASPATVLRVRKALGLKPYKRLRRPMLSGRHKERRLALANKYARQNWKRVLFTDETSFELNGKPSNEYIYCHSADEAPQQPTVKSTAKLHAWAGISWHGKTSLHLFTGILNADRYIGILDEHLDEINGIFGGGRWLLQQDSDPKHTSKKAQQWITNNTPSFITPSDWPAQSPDLNPIEHVWAKIKDRVYSRWPRTMAQLRRTVMQEWQKLDLVAVQNLTMSMPARLNAVRASNGGYTGY